MSSLFNANVTVEVIRAKDGRIESVAFLNGPSFRRHTFVYSAEGNVTDAVRSTLNGTSAHKLDGVIREVSAHMVAARAAKRAADAERLAALGTELAALYTAIKVARKANVPTDAAPVKTVAKTASK